MQSLLRWIQLIVWQPVLFAATTKNLIQRYEELHNYQEWIRDSSVRSLSIVINCFSYSTQNDLLVSFS